MLSISLVLDVDCTLYVLNIVKKNTKIIRSYHYKLMK